MKLWVGSYICVHDHLGI